MRVMFVSPAAELGGAERCLLDFVAALREQQGLELTLISFANGPLVHAARELGATVRVLEAPNELSSLGESADSLSHLDVPHLLSTSAATARFLVELRHVIVSSLPHILHTNGMKAHLLAGLVAPKSVRLVIHLHDFIGARRASKWLLPVLSRIHRNAVFIANSRAVARDFLQIEPKASVRTIYNVVDTDYFCEGTGERAWLASLAGLEPPTERTVAFGLVATYARWKGHRLFIEAAHHLRAARPDEPVQFYVIGGPIYQTQGSQVRAEELLAAAEAAGISACFGLAPFQDDIARVYRALDTVVHASTQPEPFGRTIVEAMACARTVIVSRAGGAAELFADGRNALGYEPGDARRLAEVMQRALDPELRSSLGHAARAHAVREFGRSRLGPELLRAYANNV